MNPENIYWNLTFHETLTNSWNLRICVAYLLPDFAWIAWVVWVNAYIRIGAGGQFEIQEVGAGWVICNE